MKKVGIVIEREYSDEDAKIAQEFIKERDELHDIVARQWQHGLASLVREYREKLPSLPDVEDEK